jgi:hypothetical protein
MREFVSRNRRETTAATLFAASETGWREVRAFVRERPTEALAIAGRKLALTYGSDGHAARLVRGVGVGRVGYTTEAVRRRLEAIADGFWYVVLALAILGVTQVRRWPVPARIGVLGVLLAWLGIHLVFLGGPRFHAPETPSLALLAAAGIDRLAQRGGRSRDTLGDPLHAEGGPSFATSRGGMNDE